MVSDAARFTSRGSGFLTLVFVVFIVVLRDVWPIRRLHGRRLRGRQPEFLRQRDFLGALAEFRLPVLALAGILRRERGGAAIGVSDDQIDPECWAVV